MARRVLAAPFLYVRTSWSAKKYLAYSVIVTFVLKSRALRKAASIAFMCVSWQWGSRDEKSTKIASSSTAAYLKSSPVVERLEERRRKGTTRRSAAPR